ncbi:sporulation initiation phosphotransferase B [Alkalihalobacillus sp. LMS39]|uniref:sporulation initiation phosphotransferase B n=1 Tax=Alkalihalobacillus sp. LMS39 TaxID=2924032 RepID=UPI001FB33C4B|nr:sporulation initiation phosphotransferase B [Alkalihalobacillus sp. LMS39]UOE95520.1 sporulation initiation phosphotransferase B [Alkalihalobacillus sp. LMS39]
MTKKWDVVDLLRHSRHDWLNVIQLIKGNIALHRLERVDEIIDEIIQKAQNESKLSDLKIPALASELLTINWENHLYEIELEVIGDVQDLSAYEQSLQVWCKNFFSLLDDVCSNSCENQLLLTFYLVEDDLSVSFDFQGEIQNQAIIKDWIRANDKTGTNMTIKEFVVNSEEVLLTLALVK